jgi:hypothetical protein
LNKRRRRSSKQGREEEPKIEKVRGNLEWQDCDIDVKVVCCGEATDVGRAKLGLGRRGRRERG